MFAPEWIDLCSTLGVRPRACRPYRAKTKGKVERVIRELKEDFLRWLTGQVLPSRPAVADYDRLVRTWCDEVVATRRHRTTGRVVLEAWASERQLLAPVPERLVASAQGQDVGRRARDEVHRVGGSAEAADHADVGLRCEQRPQAVAHHRVIVEQQHVNHERAESRLRRACRARETRCAACRRAPRRARACPRGPSRRGAPGARR